MRLRLLLPSYRRLMRDGAQTHAIITHVKNLRSSGTIGSPSRFELALEVHFAEGPTRSVRWRGNEKDLGREWPAVGDTVPVRYDPADPSMVEIDRALIEKNAAAEDRERDERALREARERERRR